MVIMVYNYFQASVFIHLVLLLLQDECVEVSPETGMWSDISCSDNLGAVCMMTQGMFARSIPFTAFSFLFFSFPLNLSASLPSPSALLTIPLRFTFSVFLELKSCKINWYVFKSINKKLT